MADAQFQFGAGFDCLRCASGAEGQRSVVDVPQVRLPSSPAAANYSCAKCTKPSLSLLEMAKLRSEVRDAVKQSKALREAAKQDLKSGKVAAAVGRYAGAIGVCKAAILKTQAMGAGKAAHGGSVGAARPRPRPAFAQWPACPVALPHRTRAATAHRAATCFAPARGWPRCRPAPKVAHGGPCCNRRTAPVLARNAG